jgi:hypothetical protein
MAYLYTKKIDLHKEGESELSVIPIIAFGIAVTSDLFLMIRNLENSWKQYLIFYATAFISLRYINLTGICNQP